MFSPGELVKQVSRRWCRTVCTVSLRNNSRNKTPGRSVFLQPTFRQKSRFAAFNLNLSRTFHKTSIAAGDFERIDCKTVTSDFERRTIDVTWQNGEVSSFPFLFLRDNCLCPACFDLSARHRMFLLQDLDLNCKPSSVEASGCGGNMHVAWDDGHNSVYPAAWLADHDLSEENRKKRSAWLGIKPETWGTDLTNSVPTFDFTELIEDDVVLYKWIYSLQKFGLALLKNAPAKTGQLSRIGDRIAFLRRTNYGYIYHVFIKENPSNAAYTDSALACHNDLPYFNYSPGMQMLHCMEQQNVTGGDNILVDGFFIAEKLRQEDPSAFELLTKLKIDHEDIGQDHTKFHLLCRKPIFQLDEDGNIQRVGYSNFSRATRHDVPVDMVEPMYRALKAFDTFINNPKNHIIYKMEAGDIICMNNQRVMHGRKAFKLEEGGGRELEGGYIEWDDLLSMYRVIASEIGVDGSKYLKSNVELK